jgi:hypothetical protein
MPRDTNEIVEELNDFVRLSAEPIITIPWRDFYKLCTITRFKEARGEEIQRVARETFGLFVGYGQSVVVVCHDRNFAPVAK